MSVSPRVTVIIPTYNYSSVLPYSIGSVQRQTFADWELLVIGDGCTDDSGEVVRRTAGEDARIRWINLPENFGQAAAPNNEGVRQARGEIIAYLGHDDLWLPHHLSVLTAAIDAGADMSYGIVESVQPPGEEPRAVPAHPFRYQPGQWIPPTGVLHRKATIEKAGGWRDYRTLSLTPEADLWLKMQENGGILTFVPRLTAIKMPASLRKNVYRDRPSHEQEFWTRRILEEPDLEAKELGRLVGLLNTEPEFIRIRTHVRQLAQVMARRFRYRWFGGNLNRIEQYRRYKGLAPRTNARFPEAK